MLFCYPCHNREPAMLECNKNVDYFVVGCEFKLIRTMSPPKLCCISFRVLPGKAELKQL